MATRCNIIIKDGRTKFNLYHQYDGYPEGVGADLVEFMKKYTNWKYNGFYIANALVKRTDDNGYEITDCIHGDIDFLYVVNCNKQRIECYERKDWDVSGKDIMRKDWMMIL